MTSPRKTGAFKSREFGIELLILKKGIAKEGEVTTVPFDGTN